MSASILAWGAQSGAIAPGAEGTATFNISESGVSGRFVIGDWDGAVTSIIHRNTNLTTGQVPVGLFQALSVTNPRLYRFYQINDPLSASFLNLSAAPAVAQISCTAAPNQASALPYEGDALRQYSRSLICYGGDQVIDIAPGASQQFTFQLLQAGRAGFVTIGAYGGALGTSFLNGLVVTELTHNNVALIDSPTGVAAASFSPVNQDNPLWGMQIDVNDRMTLTVRNDGAVPAESVGVALTAG
ncbi:MAG: hypothetical protein ACR2NI_11100 [Pirellulales bacterium]